MRIFLTLSDKAFCKFALEASTQAECLNEQDSISASSRAAVGLLTRRTGGEGTYGVTTSDALRRKVVLSARPRGALHEQPGGAGPVHDEAAHEDLRSVPLGAGAERFRHVVQRAAGGAESGSQLHRDAHARAARAAQRHALLANARHTRRQFDPQHRDWA